MASSCLTGFSPSPPRRLANTARRTCQRQRIWIGMEQGRTHDLVRLWIVAGKTSAIVPRKPQGSVRSLARLYWPGQAKTRHTNAAKHQTAFCTGPPIKGNRT